MATSTKRKVAALRSTEKEWAAFAAIKPASGPLFATDADLVETYLECVHGEREVHDCYACKRFLKAFGGVATIADDGHATSAVWFPETAPAFYREAAQALAEAVAKARVVGPFLSAEAVWGTPKTGDWTHFACKSPAVYSGRVLTAGQAMAAKREDLATVIRAMQDFTPQMIAEAIRLLETGHFSQAEKFIGPLHWLADLHAKRAANKGKVRDNLTWLAIATAPDGFCHPRAGVTGSLLEDIAAGMSFEAVKARFEQKVQPLQYQRPQAAPSVQNLAAAEKVVEKLGIARSLERRFARLDELETAWTPIKPKAEVPRGGVFGHLKPKGVESASVTAPAAPMTWAKFEKTVLPGAEAIEVYVPAHGSFIALTGPVHADAPVILKWGNPFAWYVYHNGSACSRWGLSPGWAKVNALVAMPTMWGANPKPNLGEGFVLVIDGAMDQQKGQGNALFPECLLQDLHGVRSSIEAYSRNAEMQGRAEGSACGLDLRAGMKTIGYRLRVTTAGLKTDYMIDRWD
jgi:hypothetical protein